jgi:hypothetical protein
MALTQTHYSTTYRKSAMLPWAQMMAFKQT